MTKEKFLEMGMSEELASKCEEVFKKVKFENEENSKKIEQLEAEKKQLIQETEDNVASYEGKINEISLENIIENEIREIGGRNKKAIKALLDCDEIKNSEDKKSNIKEQLTRLFTDEESSFLFEDMTKTKFVGVTPNFCDDDGEIMTKEDFKKMDYQQRNELFRKNKRLYNKLKG